MQVSTATNIFQKDYGYLKGIELLCQSGFDCLDMTLTNLGEGDDVLLGPDYRETVAEIKKIADRFGVRFNQSHAPWHFAYNMGLFFSDEAAHADISFRIKRSIEIAGMLGAKVIVVHPIHNENYCQKNPEQLLELNTKFYGEFVPTARAAGIKIAVENMFQRHLYTKAIVQDVCSNPNELLNYVDTLNEIYGGCFTACLDIGHCALTGVLPEQAVLVLGDRLGALHVHDNDTLTDNHTLPFTGRIDFIPVMKALKEIGYGGEFTYEADNFLKRFPKDYRPEALTFMLKTARYLTNL